MDIDFVVLVGLIGTVFGIIISFLSFNRNRDNDVKSDASESAVIRTKLDLINNGVESIRIDLKANEKRISELTERVVRVEESARSAHDLINKFHGIKEGSK